GESLDPADHELSDPLHQASVADGERRGDPPGQSHENHGQNEEGKSDPRVALDPREHMIGVLSEAGDEHHDSMRQNKEYEPAKRDEVDRASRLAVQYFPNDP